MAGTYAGLRGQDVGLTMAAMLDSIALVLDQVPAQVRRDAVAAPAATETAPTARTTHAATARDSPATTAIEPSDRGMGSVIANPSHWGNFMLVDGPNDPRGRIRKGLTSGYGH